MKLNKVPVNVGIRFHELGVMSHYYFVLPEDGGSQEISLAEIVSWFSGDLQFLPHNIKCHLFSGYGSHEFSHFQMVASYTSTIDCLGGRRKQNFTHLA